MLGAAASFECFLQHGDRVGPEIDPGVPWTTGITAKGNEQPNHKPLALALKSGNFGTPDFFLKAWNKLAT